MALFYGDWLWEQPANRWGKVSPAHGAEVREGVSFYSAGRGHLAGPVENLSGVEPFTFYPVSITSIRLSVCLSVSVLGFFSPLL